VSKIDKLKKDLDDLVDQYISTPMKHDVLLLAVLDTSDHT